MLSTKNYKQYIVEQSQPCSRERNTKTCPLTTLLFYTIPPIVMTTTKRTKKHTFIFLSTKMEEPTFLVTMLVPFICRNDLNRSHQVTDSQQSQMFQLIQFLSSLSLIHPKNQVVNHLRWLCHI